MNFLFIKRYRMLYWTAVVLVLIVLVVWFAIIPLFHRIADTKVTTQQLLVEQDNDRKKMDRLPEYQSQYERILQEKNKVFSLLEESQVVPFIESIEKNADASHVKINVTTEDQVMNKPVQKKLLKKTAASQAATPSDSATADTGIVSKLPYDTYLLLHIEVSGAYADVLDFLHKFETLGYALDVLTLDMVAPEDNSHASSGSLVVFGQKTNADNAQKMVPDIVTMLDVAVYKEKK